MLHTILVIAAIAAGALIVLYMLARRYPLFGDSLAFPLIFVVRPLVTLQKMLESAGRYCHGVFEKSLNYPPGVIGDAWHGVNVIARNILLNISSIIITGDVYGTLQTLPLLFGGAGAVDLPGSFAIPSALLFVSMSALYGAVALECAGLLPYGAHLFPKMSDKVRKWLGILCGIGFALSLVFAVLFWIFKGWYIASPDDAGVLAIPVLALVGLLITGASVLAFWGLVVGFTGLLSIVFWLLSFAFHAGAGGVSIALSQADVFVRYITNGRWSIYIDLLGHEPQKPLASPFPALQPGQKPTASLPERASTVVDAEIFQPFETQELESTKTMNPDKNAFFCFKGMFGSLMFPHVTPAIERRGATESILASYFLDRTRTNVNTTIDGIRDLSHTLAEKNTTMLHGESEDQGDHILLCDLTHKVASVYQHLRAITAPFVYFIGIDDILPAIDLIEANKRRLPLISQVVITSVSKHDLERKSVITSINDLVALQREQIIDNVVVIDLQHSKLKNLHGEDTVLRFLAQMVIELVIAHKHHPLNLSFPSVFRQLGHLSPFTTVSFASENVVIGNLPTRWKFANLLPGVKGQAGTGSYADVLSQTRAAIDRVVNSEDCRAFPGTIPTDCLSVILSTAPFDLNDRRFNTLVEDNSLYVSSRYSFGKSTTTSGNGVPYSPKHLPSRLRVTSACLYPLHPATLLRLPEGKSTKVTTLYSVTSLEHASSNGTGSTQETKPEVMPTKPVAKATHKKAAPTRRVARKTKQAQ